MSRERTTQAVIRSLGKHPYLWALGLCLFIHPFFFGSIENIPGNALWLETFIMLGVIGALGAYKYRSGELSRGRTVIFIALLTIADLAVTKLYSQSRNRALWHFAGGCGAVFLLYQLADMKKYRMQINSLMIMGLGFFLKLYYVLTTSVYTRQHDVRSFGGDTGHFGYMEYLLYHRRLPDMDIREYWQFCHPPLHHAISAFWIYINEDILRVGYDQARESLQTLTLFYSMCIIISAYRLLRYFKLEGKALYIPLLLVSFHPAFIYFSGSVNNDVLSVAFILGAMVSVLEWYREQTLKHILSAALCIGLGMMTKVSAAVIAPAAALVFLIVFIKKFKSDRKRLFIQFIIFGAVCLPLGLWFGVRNHIKWDLPLTYVQEMDKSELQYIGDRDYAARITDFSPSQLDSVYLQWAEEDEDGNIRGYNEYNPTIALIKTSVFGEYVNEGSFGAAAWLNGAAKVLFRDNLLLAGAGTACMIWLLFRRCGADGVQKVFLTVFWLTMMVSYYKMAHDYPFTCTMEFRYVTPAAVIGSIFIGLGLKQAESSPSGRKVFAVPAAACTGVFCTACMSVILGSCV